MFLPRTRKIALLAVVAAVALVGACSDNLESNADCPSLCPGQLVTLRDTVLDAVVIDSSVPGFPPIGQSPLLLVSTRGDTIDTRAIVRFDTLPSTFTRSGSAVDSAILGVDSAYLLLQLDTTLALPGAPITVGVYDVDTGNPDSLAVDTTAALLAPLFSPERLLGSQTYTPDSLVRDTLRVPISSDSLLGYITSKRRLRVGVMVTGSNRAQLRIETSVNYTPPEIQFKPAKHGDTTGVVPLYVSPISATPTSGPLAGSTLLNFGITVKGTPNTSGPVLAIGGLPGRRAYIRFDLPSKIVDSSTVVRATLEMNQIPNPLSPDPHDTAAVWPQALLASATVTNLNAALRILSSIGDFGLDTLERFAPADSGLRQFEMVNLVRVWHTALSTTDPRALALRAEFEGSSGALYWFTPSSGPAALRPRIHITYAPSLAARGSQ